MALTGRVILVTGASSGLGRHAARALAAAGATVVLLGRHEGRLNGVYDDILAADGPRPVVLPFDLAEADDPRFEALADTLGRELGRLDGILHSAAQFIKLGKLAHQRLKHWQEAFATNVMAPFALTRACLPLLEGSDDAAVLFSAEQHGLALGAYWGGFGLSQATSVGLAQLFAAEHRDNLDLRFNVLIPGPVASPMRHRTHPGEMPENLPAIASLMPYYVTWLGPDSRGQSGKIIQPDLGYNPFQVPS